MGELDGVPAALVMPSGRELWAISMDGTRLVLERSEGGSVRAWRGEYDWTRPAELGRPLGRAVLLAGDGEVMIWTGSTSMILRVDRPLPDEWFEQEERS